MKTRAWRSGCTSFDVLMTRTMSGIPTTSSSGWSNINPENWQPTRQSACLLSFVYSSELATREEAFAAERRIKGWSRKKKEALMRGDWEELRRLARGSDRKDPSTSIARADARNPKFWI